MIRIYTARGVAVHARNFTHANQLFLLNQLLYWQEIQEDWTELSAREVECKCYLSWEEVDEEYTGMRMLNF